MQMETRSNQSLQIESVTHPQGSAQRHFLPALFLFSFLIVLPSMPIRAWGAAQTPAQPSVQVPAQPANVTPAAQMTLAIFTDPTAPHLSDGLWTALVTALNEELTSASPETRSIIRQNEDPATAPQLQILRGDRLPSGLVFNHSITVYLHGECVATPTIRSNLFTHAHPSEALGWVRVKDAVIEPFIHVECDHIGEVLGVQRVRVNSSQRDNLMAGAIAQVIVHEWIHVSTQSAHHTRQGITKAQFGVNDLRAHASRPREKHGSHSSISDCTEVAECGILPALDSSNQSRVRGTK